MTDGRNGGGRRRKPAPTIDYAAVTNHFHIEKPGLTSPSVGRREDGTIYIRVVTSITVRGTKETRSYDYFELDADGVVTKAPRGYAGGWKGMRIGGIEMALIEHAAVTS